MKEYPIKYNGTDGVLQIEDANRVKAGVIIPIIKRSLKYKVGQQLPELDEGEWLVGIATNCVIKAPWGDVRSPDLIRNLDVETYEQLAYIIGDEYPMERFLSLGAKLMYGKKLEISISDSQTISTTSSPSGESPSGK